MRGTTTPVQLDGLEPYVADLGWLIDEGPATDLWAAAVAGRPARPGGGGSWLERCDCPEDCPRDHANE